MTRAVKAFEFITEIYKNHRDLFFQMQTLIAEEVFFVYDNILVEMVFHYRITFYTRILRYYSTQS